MKKPEFHFPPLFRKLERGGPAVVLPKDIGMIIAYTGLNKESTVVEAGAGTGFLTVALAQIAKRVVSYEQKPEFAALARSNVEKAGLSNVEIRQRNVLEGIEETDVDVVVLDMPDADKVVPLAYAALKKGGCLAGYLPHTEQMKAFLVAAQNARFSEVFALENIIREYEVRDFGVRPQHWGLTHTAYLVFARK